MRGVAAARNAYTGAISPRRGADVTRVSVAYPLDVHAECASQFPPTIDLTWQPSPRAQHPPRARLEKPFFPLSLSPSLPRVLRTFALLLSPFPGVSLPPGAFIPLAPSPSLIQTAAAAATTPPPRGSLLFLDVNISSTTSPPSTQQWRCPWVRASARAFALLHRLPLSLSLSLLPSLLERACGQPCVRGGVRETRGKDI